MIVSHERHHVGSSYELMEDKHFQDWLKDAHILVVTQDQPDLIFRQPPTRQETYLAEFLQGNKGYLFPPYAPFKHDDGVDLQYEVWRTRSHISNLRDKIEDPAVIFEAQGFGYGLGVAKMAITRGVGRLLYRLWLKEGEFVDRVTLARDLFGGAGSHEADSLKAYVYILRRELRGTKTRLETGEKSYRILENPPPR